MRIPKARWYRITVMIFVLYLIANVDRSNISMAIPDMAKDLSLSSAATGVLLSAFFWGYIITQIPGGLLASKYSAKMTVFIATIVCGIAAILSGFTTDYKLFLVLRFVLGLAEGVIWPAFVVLYVNWFPDSERARAINVCQSTVPIASIIIGPLSAWMITKWGYHEMFIFQGIPAVVIAILFALLVFDSPSKDKFISKSEREFLENNRSTSAKEEGSFKEVILNIRVWVFALIYFFWITGMYGFSMWLPSLITQLSNTGLNGVGWLTALTYLFSLISMYGIAYISDKRASSSKNGLNRSMFVAIPLLISGLALVIQHSISGASLTISMILMFVTAMGLYVNGSWWAWVLTYVPRNQSGAAIGFINLCGNLGGVVGPIIIGLAAQGEDLSNGFYIMGFSLILSAVLIAIVSWSSKTSVFNDKKKNNEGNTIIP
ncbi:MFS transporter [Priestia endophytica]|uniref:MFS transporter n=1 Tax=Priestia endophytica TaxID=135735 RepID=UPI000DCA634A|nr:MFS transporter [Priestia endophytica]RAS80738.1 hypothetical protein A4U60_14250 [Priestia endophytica]